MVLTRGGKKRGSSATSGGKGQTAKKTKKTDNARTSKKGSNVLASGAAQAKKKKPKGLMDMPPEIRNRVYHFAIERDNFEGWEEAVPLVEVHTGHSCGRSQWPMSKYDCFLSARNFLGLTQVCKLVRKEYRPIWLRNSSIRVRPFYLPLYIHTFYGCGTDYSENMPKLIQLSHNQDAMGQDTLDLTQMLRIHAASPTTQFEVVPHELTLDEGPWSEDVDPSDCELCEEELMSGELDEDDFEEMGCPHDHFRRAAYADYLLIDEYPYLAALNRLLAHDNAKWLEDIRSRDVLRVKLDTSEGDNSAPEVIIRLSHGSDTITSKLSKKSMLGAASDYTNDRNLGGTSIDDVSLHFMLQICGGAH